MLSEYSLILILLLLYFQLSANSRRLKEEFKKTKIKIEKDKAKEEAMLSSIGDGVVATDKNGIIIFFNQAARDMLSWGDEMMGKKLGEISLLADEKGGHITLEKHPLHLSLVKRKKIITSDYHFIRKDKVDLAVYISAMPIILKNEIVGAIEVFRDITQEKEIDKIKSEFVFLASHQLRTPLSTINWYVEMLLSGDAGPINDDQKKYLQEVYDGNHRMVEMVNDLLNVSRLDLGTLAVQLVPINIEELISEVEKEGTSAIEDKKLKIEKNIPIDLPEISSDIKMMRMLLQNLITNAIKYTPPGGKITVSIETQNKKEYRLVVADTGYGIPATAQDKIFTKLFRAENVMEKEITGTGLGLYMVKSIVEQLGGKIWFESKENIGTKFFVSFPFKPVIKKKKI
jgi:PAS domain S-box-containing protein